MADIVAGFAAYTVVAREKDVVTAEIKISYLRAATKGKLFAEGRVIKAGRQFVFVESEVRESSDDPDGGRLLAKASTTMAVIEGRDVS